jgi:hypothetical protein
VGALDRIRDRTGLSTAVDLRRRMKVLEDEVQECRALSLRLAELTDIVTELLLPVAQRDEKKLEELLERYHRAL